METTVSDVRPDVRVLVLIGSLRPASVNREIANLAADNAPDGIAVEIFEGLGDVPFYNEDIDGSDAPPAAVQLRDAVAGADAVLVVTPEYNGSLPAVVKNAIDWLSRPMGQSAVAGKPLAVIGGALGRYGGVWAHDETRKSFGIAGARVVGELALSVPLGSLDGTAPHDNAHLVADVGDVLEKLVAEVSEQVC